MLWQSGLLPGFWEDWKIDMGCFRKARVFGGHEAIKPHFDCTARFSEMSQIWAQEGMLRLSARTRGFLQISFDD